MSKLNINTALLHPALQTALSKFLDAAGKAGYNVLITSGLRDKAEQDALYAQGRTTKGAIVTNVKYPNSMHNWGIAVDFCQNLASKEYDEKWLKTVAQIAKQYGFDWGGDWKSFQDTPHLQLKAFSPDGTTAWLVKTYGTPEAFRKTWVLSDDNTSRPTLKKGDKGKDVLTLQELLNERQGGYPVYSAAKPTVYKKFGLSNDTFGDNTLNAVKAWQIKCGLVVDGVVGAKTWGSLG